MRQVFTLVAIAAIAAACHSDAPPPLEMGKPAEPATQPIACTEPRPQMCTKQYVPVCATRDTGVRCVTTPCDSTEQRTYGNGCTACADAAVHTYVPGACEERPKGDDEAPRDRIR